MLKRSENSHVSDTSATVLVVDDTSSSRMVARKTLNDLGFFTLIASDGEAALAKVRDFHPDAIVTDLEMPGMDGEELIEMLRSSQNPCIRDIPIIVSSSKVDVRTLSKLVSLQVDAFVPKPVDVRLLAKKALQLFKII